jgi:hypothetical protein
MSSFDNRIIEIPHKSPWHLFTGTIVIVCGSISGLWTLSWLLA